MKSIVLILMSLSIVGCASSRLRKNCESTNWFKRGEDLAKRNKLPEHDFYIKKCEAAEGFVNYAELDRGFKSARENQCDSKKALEAGRKGQIFDFSICFSHNEAKIRQAYEKGLRQFCSPKQALQFGKSGKEAKVKCPSPLAQKFASNFAVGRKQYLSSTLQSKLGLLSKVSTNLKNLDQKRDQLKRQLRRSRSKSSKQSIRRELQTLNFDRDSVEAEQLTLREEVSNLEMELAKIK